MNPEKKNRVRGALVGLATGDALGTTLEFKRPDSFEPITDMVGGGPFRLQPGQWTDDTSMALCLAESLIERHGMDAHDQLKRYVAWWHEGHLSATGRCFDIGNTVSAALRAFESTGRTDAASSDRMSAGNGSIMRLAPVAMYYSTDVKTGIDASAESSRTTHPTVVAVDACRYLAAILIGAMNGATKDELTSSLFTPVAGYWHEAPVCPEIHEIASGSFKGKHPPDIRGSGYSADSLEAALWAFHTTSDFRSGALAAVNLGDDADTTGAVFGQIAGAFYGEAAIPAEWRAKLALWAVIDRYAEQLSC